MINVLNKVMEKMDEINQKMDNLKIFESYKNNQMSILKQKYTNQN